MSEPGETSTDPKVNLVNTNSEEPVVDTRGAGDVAGADQQAERNVHMAFHNPISQRERKGTGSTNNPKKRRQRDSSRRTVSEMVKKYFIK